MIEYVRRQEHQTDWEKLRDAAFVAAAVPSAENIAELRRLADEAMGGA